MTQAFYNETQLPDGPLVLSHAMPHSQSVALGIFIDVGSRDESIDQAGITHALEHMLFKGTDGMNVHQLAEKLDELGGNANAFTSRERTCFHLHVLREHWQEALAILTAMVRQPALPADEWLREREVIFSEMSMVDDMPDEWLTDRHVEALFPEHALGLPVLGNHDALNGLSRRDLQAYLQHWYKPPRLLIVAAGCIEHDALVDHIAAMDWATGGDAHTRHPAPQMSSGIQALPRDIEQTQVVISFPGLTATSGQRPVAWLANQLLGGGMSSSLFREVREKRGLAYSVGSHLNSLSDTGTWSITCGAETSRAAECVDVISNILSAFPQAMTAAELLRAKRQMEVQFRMGLDSVEGQMLYLGARLDETTLISPMAWLQQIHAVELHEVQAWATAQLTQKHLWSIAAPEQALAEICDRIPAC